MNAVKPEYVVELRDVALAELSEPVNVQLPPGGLMWVDMGPEHVELIGDVVQGLTEPDAGEVLYCGHQWETQSPDAEALARYSMKRVFSHKGWISNLDVDENLVLAHYHHESGDPVVFHQECQEVAQRLGLKICKGRPELFHAQDLHPMQWVRAFSGSCELLIVGYRVELFPPGLEDRIADLLEERMKQGLAVLWMGPILPDRLRSVPQEGMCATLKLADSEEVNK